MAVNFAAKYSSAVDERFTFASFTQAAVNRNYDADFEGAKTVKVYSLETFDMNDYTRSGSSRYGTPSELQDTVQELTMSQDRSWTGTIDRGNLIDTAMVREVGAALRRQLDEVVIPEVDTYRLGVICANAGTTATGTPTKANAYELFLAGQEAISDAKAPLTGRVAFVRNSFFNLLKLDPAFIKAGDLSQEMLIRGQLGAVDGVAIVPIPVSYFPDGVHFVITHPIATTAPVKLDTYKAHEDPPGINGWLLEGRIYHDAFVLNNKAEAIYVFEAA